MAEGYGLRDTTGLVDAIARRQEENLAETVGRARSPDAAVARYAREAAAWQCTQMAWLHANADVLRQGLEGA